MTIFRSKGSDLSIHEIGWVWLPSGVEITRLPVWDVGRDIAARVGPGAMADWLKPHGMRLPSVPEYDELKALSLHIEPVTLPDAAMLRLFGIPSNSEDAIDSFRNANMSSLEWCKLHDAEVRRRLAMAGWVDEPVDNWGKHWAAPHTIYGWWRAGQKMIQTPYTGHGIDHVDYASTSHAVREAGNVIRPPDSYSSWADGVVLDDLSLGERCCLWLGYQFGLDIRETPGTVDNETILSYSEHCRRGGRLLGVTQDNTPVWDGGTPLPLPDDESAWCAATQSECLRCCLLPGEKPPHGLRVSVRELVEDAREAGTLRPPEWRPTPGSLAILGRAGRSPLEGGPGHVRGVILVDGDRYRAIGGNEADSVRYDWHSLSDVLAWVER